MVERLASGHQEELIEREQRTDDAEQRNQQYGTSGERQCDPSDALPVARTVGHRRLIDVLRDRLDGGDEKKHAKADYLPDVALAFNYLSPFNVEVLPTNIASIGLQLKWEPWDWGRRKDIVNQKKISETQAQNQLQDTQSKVLMDVNSRFRKLEESRILIVVAQAAREAAQQKLSEVTNKYEQQAVLLKDVLQQQANAAAAQDDYQQALLGFWSAKTDFEKSLGEDQ